MTEKFERDKDENTHFVTFSCFKRRRLLSADNPKRIVVSFMRSELLKLDGSCVGFVIMPDHVHAIVYFPGPDRLSHFIKEWKRKSSANIKRNLREFAPQYFSTISESDPIWQAGYNCFDIYSESKLFEKLEYIHENPVRASLVEYADDWPFSSAKWYSYGHPVGVAIDPIL